MGSKAALHRANVELLQSYLIVGSQKDLPAFKDMLEILSQKIFTNARDAYNQLDLLISPKFPLHPIICWWILHYILTTRLLNLVLGKLLSSILIEDIGVINLNNNNNNNNNNNINKIPSISPIIVHEKNWAQWNTYSIGDGQFHNTLTMQSLSTNDNIQRKPMRDEQVWKSEFSNGDWKNLFYLMT